MRGTTWRSARTISSDQAAPSLPIPLRQQDGDVERPTPQQLWNDAPTRELSAPSSLDDAVRSQAMSEGISIGAQEAIRERVSQNSVSSAMFSSMNASLSRPFDADAAKQMRNNIVMTHKFFMDLTELDREIFAIVTQDISLQNTGGLQSIKRRLWENREIPKVGSMVLQMLQIALNVFTMVRMSMRVLSFGADDRLRLSMSAGSLRICSRHLRQVGSGEMGCFQTSLVRKQMTELFIVTEAIVVCSVTACIVWTAIRLHCSRKPCEYAGRRYFVLMALPKITARFSFLIFLHLANMDRLKSFLLRGEFRCLWSLFFDSIRSNLHKLLVVPGAKAVHMLPSKESFLDAPNALIKYLRPSKVSGHSGPSQADSSPTSIGTLTEQGDSSVWPEVGDYAKVSRKFGCTRELCISALGLFVCALLIIVALHSLVIKLMMLYFVGISSYMDWDFQEWIMFAGFVNQLSGIAFSSEVETLRVLLFRFGGEHTKWTAKQIQVCGTYFRFLAARLVEQAGTRVGLVLMWTMCSADLQSLFQGHQRLKEQTAVLGDTISMFERIADSEALVAMRDKLLRNFTECDSLLDEELPNIPHDKRVEMLNIVQTRAIGELRLAAKVQEHIWQWKKVKLQEEEELQAAASLNEPQELGSTASEVMTGTEPAAPPPAAAPPTDCAASAEARPAMLVPVLPGTQPVAQSPAVAPQMGCAAPEPAAPLPAVVPPMGCTAPVEAGVPLMPGNARDQRTLPDIAASPHYGSDGTSRGSRSMGQLSPRSGQWWFQSSDKDDVQVAEVGSPFFSTMGSEEPLTTNACNAELVGTAASACSATPHRASIKEDSATSVRTPFGSEGCCASSSSTSLVAGAVGGRHGGEVRRRLDMTVLAESAAAATMATEPAAEPSLASGVAGDGVPPLAPLHAVLDAAQQANGVAVGGVKAAVSPPSGLRRQPSPRGGASSPRGESVPTLLAAEDEEDVNVEATIEDVRVQEAHLLRDVGPCTKVVMNPSRESPGAFFIARLQAARGRSPDRERGGTPSHGASGCRPKRAAAASGTARPMPRQTSPSPDPVLSNPHIALELEKADLAWDRAMAGASADFDLLRGDRFRWVAPWERSSSYGQLMQSL